MIDPKLQKKVDNAGVAALSESLSELTAHITSEVQDISDAVDITTTHLVETKNSLKKLDAEALKKADLETVAKKVAGNIKVPADGKNGKDGLDGLDGKPGTDGKDGKDGSPDTGDEIIVKVNKSSSFINAERIKGFPDFGRGKLAPDGYPRGLPQPAASMTYRLNGAQVGRGNILNFTGSGVTAHPNDDGITYNITGGGGAGNPSAPDTSVQYNNAGVFYGDALFTRDSITNETIVNRVFNNVVNTYDVQSSFVVVLGTITGGVLSIGDTITQTTGVGAGTTAVVTFYDSGSKVTEVTTIVPVAGGFNAGATIDNGVGVTGTIGIVFPNNLIVGDVLIIEDFPGPTIPGLATVTNIIAGGYTVSSTVAILPTNVLTKQSLLDGTGVLSVVANTPIVTPITTGFVTNNNIAGFGIKGSAISSSDATFGQATIGVFDFSAMALGGGQETAGMIITDVGGGNTNTFLNTNYSGAWSLVNSAGDTAGLTLLPDTFSLISQPASLGSSLKGFQTFGTGATQHIGWTFGAQDFYLPESDGSSGQAIVTDGAGGLSFQTITGSGVPGGTVNAVQINDGASGFYGDSALFSFDYSSGPTLTLKPYKGIWIDSALDSYWLGRYDMAGLTNYIGLGANTFQYTNMIPIFGVPVHTGGGPSGIIARTIGYTGPATRTYTITVASTGTPNTFDWTDGTNSGTGVNFATTFIALSDGVYVKWASTTGHTLASQWTITVAPALNVAIKAQDYVVALGDTLVQNHNDLFTIDTNYGLHDTYISSAWSLKTEQMDTMMAVNTQPGLEAIYIGDQLGFSTHAFTLMDIPSGVFSVKNNTTDFLSINTVGHIYQLGATSGTTFNSNLIINDPAQTFVVSLGGIAPELAIDKAGKTARLGGVNTNEGNISFDDTAFTSTWATKNGQLYATKIILNGADETITFSNGHIDTGIRDITYNSSNGLNLSDYIIRITGSTGAVAIALDSVAFAIGQVLIIKDFDCIASTSNITLDAGTGNTISGSSIAQTFVMNTNGQCVTIRKVSSTAWQIE